MTEDVLNAKKIEKEKRWYERPPRKDTIWRRLLHHPILYSYERVRFNYVFPKKQMGMMVDRHRKGRVRNILIAPCGRGDDFQYMESHAQQIYGLDVSPIALKECPKAMTGSLGDIRRLPYRDETFDLVAAPLFFHHMIDYGFAPYLLEFYRVLKPNGGIVLLEPSIWYPLNILTRPIKYLFRNPYDEVEDEGPFRPKQMESTMRKVGFINLEIQAATFSHCAFYIPAAKAINRLTSKFLNTWPAKNFGWLILYWGEKKGQSSPTANNEVSIRP